MIPDRIHGIGEFRDIREDDVEIHMDVQKPGRTTSRTKGRISAVTLDDMGADMETTVTVFDNRIEIESTQPRKPFCLGGDSSSLTLDSDNRAAAMVFAGSEEGGAGTAGIRRWQTCPSTIDRRRREEAEVQPCCTAGASFFSFHVLCT